MTMTMTEDDDDEDKNEDADDDDDGDGDGDGDEPGDHNDVKSVHSGEILEVAASIIPHQVGAFNPFLAVVFVKSPR